MKNLQNLLALLFFITLLFSCTVDSINDEKPETNQEIYATGDNNSGEVDDERGDG